MPQYKFKSLSIWLSRSKKEIEILERNILNDELYFSYFIAQQSLEKLFKILISIAGVDFEKTHDLFDLYTKVKNIYGEDVSFLKGNSMLFDKLNTMYFDERYGLDRIDYVKDEIIAIVGILNKTYDFTDSSVNSL